MEKYLPKVAAICKGVEIMVPFGDFTEAMEELLFVRIEFPNGLPKSSGIGLIFIYYNH